MNGTVINLNATVYPETRGESWSLLDAFVPSQLLYFEAILTPLRSFYLQWFIWHLWTHRSCSFLVPRCSPPFELPSLTFGSYRSHRCSPSSTDPAWSRADSGSYPATRPRRCRLASGESSVRSASDGSDFDLIWPSAVETTRFSQAIGLLAVSPLSLRSALRGRLLW
jgi:hypothetical protein